MAVPTAGDISPRLLPASLAFDKPPMEKALCSEFTPNRLGFPSEFPFEFDSPTFSSAFTSPGDSTETEDESSDDEEDFLAGLTRRLALSTQRLPPPTFPSDKTEEKPQVVSTSPQSTLSGLGSWSASGSGSPNGSSSQVPSPPTTPFRKDDTWDVISAAAGQVAKLKMGGGGCEPLFCRPNSNSNPNPNSLFRRHVQTPEPVLPHIISHQTAAFCKDQAYPQFFNQVLLNENEPKQPQLYADWSWHPNRSYYQSQLKFKSPEQQIPRRVSGVIGCENGRCIRPATWLRSPPPQPQQQQQPSSAVRSGVFPVGSAVKRPCAGTGVFLPRRYTNPSESRKKSGGSSVVLPSKVVVHPQNLNFDEFNDLAQPHSRPCLSSGHSHVDYESLMARRSGLLVRQGSLRPVPGGCLNQERPLPQEWMY